MGITESNVEHGVLEQQNEKYNRGDMDVSEVERVSSPEIPAGVPVEDVVTPKTWLVVIVSLP